ncbi:hypothetical protein [Pseudomonas sp. RT6P73]
MDQLITNAVQARRPKAGFSLQHRGRKRALGFGDLGIWDFVAAVEQREAATAVFLKKLSCRVCDGFAAGRCLAGLDSCYRGTITHPIPDLVVARLRFECRGAAHCSGLFRVKKLNRLRSAPKGIGDVAIVDQRSQVAITFPNKIQLCREKHNGPDKNETIRCRHTANAEHGQYTQKRRPPTQQIEKLKALYNEFLSIRRQVLIKSGA